jgi:hypothetical protein
LAIFVVIRLASSPIRSFAADRRLCHANNNDTTTLAAVANALVSGLRVADMSPLSVAVWARRCFLLALFMAIRRTPFIALSVVKAGDQRGNLPSQLNVDYGKADHGISAGLDCRSTD